MPIEQFTPDHSLWPAFGAHLARAAMAQWVIDDEGQPKPDVHFLGVIDGDRVIGHISLKVQDIIIPATEWSSGMETPLAGPEGEWLRETFVQTFAVDDVRRRQGHGRALQFAALELTKALGCYQMRSWSSLDKPANFALKLNLGFAAHPATHQTESGEQVSGVYFVKTV